MMASQEKKAASLESELLELHLRATKTEQDHFVKRREHFNEKATEFVPNKDEPYHSFNLFTKKCKPNSSQQYSLNQWIEITTAVESDEFQEEYCLFNILMGEIYRFELGNEMPKYRMVETSYECYKLITKKITDLIETDFQEYYIKHIEPKIKYTLGKQTVDGLEKAVWEGEPYQGEEIFEGMGGGLVMKYLYPDDDFHFGNGLVINKDGHKIFIPIDHDRSLWPFLAKFQSDIAKHDRPVEADKILEYASTHPDAELIYDSKDCIVRESKIKGIKNKDMGMQNEEDYATLPLIKHRFPKLWTWMYALTKPYSEAVSKNKMVQNEISFFRLKSCLTSYLKTYLVEYHFGRYEDFAEIKNELHTKIQTELSNAKALCEKSPIIHEYLSTHRIAILQTMLYEVNQAFNDNKHYIPSNKTTWEDIWSKMADLTITNFNNMLIAKKLAPLSTSEIEKLKFFAKNCETGAPEAIKDVIQFYNIMGRKYAAFAASKKLPQVADKATIAICR